MVKKTLIGLMAASAATLSLAAPASADDDVWWSLTSQVEPGGRITADMYAGMGHGCGPAGPVTSAGFAAPIKWVGLGNWGHMGGSTTAVRRPGKYTASFPCVGGRTTTRTFTVLGTPPKPPTTKPKPPTTKPKPAKPQVGVKPAGAPQTGDGSLS